MLALLKGETISLEDDDRPAGEDTLEPKAASAGKVKKARVKKTSTKGKVEEKEEMPAGKSLDTKAKKTTKRQPKPKSKSNGSNEVKGVPKSDREKVVAGGEEHDTLAPAEVAKAA